MKPNTKTTLVLAVILLSTLWLVNIQNSHGAKTFTVPTDYPTISEAINHASDGDNIVVKSGIYRENLLINKSISIIGENRETTILIGAGGLDKGARPVVTLSADYARISGFAIKSKPYANTAQYATGIAIQADHCIIQDNTIGDTYIGIFCSVQSYTSIVGNIIADNIKDGLRFYGGSFNNISGNHIVGNAVSGMAIQGYSNSITNNTFELNLRALGLGSSYSVVYGNKMDSNTESAVFIVGSNNIVAANEISNK